MALHEVKLPKSARELCRIVAMQKMLLKALCAEPMSANVISQVWLGQVWRCQEAVWIEKFCRKRKYSVLDPLKSIADAPATVRGALYEEFCRQNRVKLVFEAGGQFSKLTTLTGVTDAIALEVHRLLVRFYKFLGHDAQAEWDGYKFPRGRSIKNESYKADFETFNRPTLAVCPYCDGPNDEPDLDHYYAKESFPFLSCSPWNLVPACHYCNKLGAKGGRLALTPSVANPTANWLHPFFRPALPTAQIRLSGNPKNSIPQLYSSDAAEQGRLVNHAALIPTLSKRWTNVVTSYHDRLVRQVNQRLNATNTIDAIVRSELDTHVDDRGRFPSSMVHAAVCRAVLDRRPEYLEEFANSNPPQLG